MITLLQLQQICPKTRKSILEKCVEPLNAAMDEWGIDTPQRVAAFLAQVAHESGGFYYVREIADGSAYDGRADLGNTRPEAIRIANEHDTTPGRFWRGRGWIMVTGYDNYLSCGIALNLDLADRPELLESPENAARSAGWFWRSRRLNALADADNFRKITIKINGGLNGYADRCAYWERAKEVLA